MGYRSFNDNTTLDTAGEFTEYTFEALEAHAAHKVNEFAKPLASHLDLLAQAEGNRRTARRATVRANARVRMRDGDADDYMREFGKDVLGEVRQDRSAPLYRTIFSGTVADVVNLSLAPELDEIEGIITTLEDKTVPAELRKKWVPIWKKVVVAGRAALAEREAAARATATSSLEVERWISRADKLRRAIDGALTQFAAENELAADFNERFFPVVSAAKKSKKPAATDSTPASTSAPT